MAKGDYKGTCNLSACKTGAPATWYNHGSRAHYCPECAARLNNDPFNKKDAQRLFGHDLCTPVLKITVEQMKHYVDTLLEMVMTDHKIDYVGRETDRMIGLHQWDSSGKLWSVLTEGGSKPNPSKVKPICYRMTDLDKMIPELGFVPAKELAKLITQAGWEYENITEMSVENDTITLSWPIRTQCLTESRTQRFFEIDIDEDFGFGIYLKVWVDEGDPEERESCTGNIWAMYQKLFEWNFWPFGEDYFKAGLVIDKMTFGKQVIPVCGDTDQGEGKEEINV